ncbi:MAG: hypothetical protein RL072_1782 [Actinomycetota bacterium]|jgi:hypothetical protein
METVSLTSRQTANIVALASSIPSLIGNRRGIGISWDSTDYIAVGLSMSAGRGALDVTGQPMVIRPPGLSAFVTIGDWLSVSPDFTLRIVNAVSMMVVVWGVHRLLVRAGVRTIAKWIGVALVALSPALLDIFTMAWSEPPFIALVVLAMLVVTRPRAWPWDIALALVFTVMFFVRYIGPFYVAPLAFVAALVQLKRSGWLLSFMRAGSALAVSMVAPWLWLMRNKEISGYLTGYREPGGGSLLDPLKTFTGTVGSWLIARPPLDGNGGIYLKWADFSLFMQIAGVLVWVLILGLISGYIAIRYAWRRDKHLQRPNTAVLMASAVLFVFYGAFSVYRFVYDEMGPLDSRMMSGLYVPLVLMFVIAGDSLQADSSRVSRGISRALAVLGIAVVVGHGAVSARDSIRYGSEGRYWGSITHKLLPVHLFANGLPSNSVLYSNEPQSLFAATLRWPIRNQFLIDKPPLLPCDRRYFVWYNQTYLPDGKPVGGEVIFEDAIAQVIDLDTCDTDISRFWP